MIASSYLVRQEGSGPIIKAIRHGHPNLVKLFLSDRRVDISAKLKVRCTWAGSEATTVTTNAAVAVGLLYSSRRRGMVPTRHRRHAFRRRAR